MRSRRAVVALALVGLVAGSACAPDDPAIIDPDVRLFSQLVGPEADALVDTLEPFTEATGITVRLVSSTNLERDLIERVQADEPPDVALVPQPGLVDGLASQLGALQPLPPEVLGQLRPALGRPDHRRRSGLRRVRPGQRQEPRVVLAEGVR